MDNFEKTCSNCKFDNRINSICGMCFKQSNWDHQLASNYPNGRFNLFKKNIESIWDAHFPNAITKPVNFMFVKEVPTMGKINFYSLINKKIVDPLRWSIDNKVYFTIDKEIFIKT